MMEKIFDNVGNTSVMYVRVYGRLVPIEQVTFVQLDSEKKDIISEVPLKEPITRLMWNNLHNFVKEGVLKW